MRWALIAWSRFHRASKASDPAVRQYLFGHLDPNRVQFTIGCDIHLTPHTAEPLNYFIDPYAEGDGRKVGKGAVALEFRGEGMPVAATDSHGQM